MIHDLLLRSSSSSLLVIQAFGTEFEGQFRSINSTLFLTTQLTDSLMYFDQNKRWTCMYCSWPHHKKCDFDESINVEHDQLKFEKYNKTFKNTRSHHICSWRPTQNSSDWMLVVVSSASRSLRQPPLGSIIWLLPTHNQSILPEVNFLKYAIIGGTQVRTSTIFVWSKEHSRNFPESNYVFRSFISKDYHFVCCILSCFL